MRRRRLPAPVVVPAAASAATLVLAAMTTTAAAPAAAATQRFALLVAAHDGGAGLARLRYAGRDARLVKDVLVDAGGFAATDVLVVVDGTADDVRGGFAALDARVADAHGRGDDVVVVVYYSGHAKDAALLLHDETFAMSELRARLEHTGADVRLAFLDACGAGAATRQKGASLAAPFVVKIEPELAARGQVIVASSSASEVSQESDEIQGSFFTHYLTTGLRGDADRDHDGRVTLDEAYGYAYGRTVAATATTRSGAQHPTYAYALQGAGDVVLTNPGGADVVVQFPDGLEGRYFVVDLDRQLFVAEVDKQKGDASSIALPRGQYAIKKRLDSHLLMTRVHAREKGTIVVDDAVMDRVSFADDFAKGSPIAVSAVVPRELGLSLAVGAGLHTVLDPARIAANSVADDGLFPSMPLVQGTARLHGLLNRDVDVDIDLAFGSVPSTRTVDGGPLGTIRYDERVDQLQAGVGVMWVPPLGEGWGADDVTARLGVRGAGYLFTHTFTGEVRPSGLEQQSYLTFTPGIGVDVGWSPLPHVHLEVGARAHYLPYTVDELRHLVVGEAFASVWLDL